MSDTIANQTPAKALLAVISRDPLYRLTRTELFQTFSHLNERIDKGWADIESVPVQLALKAVVRAIVEAERQIEIRQTEESIGNAKRLLQESQDALKKHKQRLADLTGEVHGD